MTPNEVRAAIRAAEQDLETVRREMDECADKNGGFIPRAAAEAFARRLEDAETRRWEFRTLLRTPRPSA